MEIKRVVEKEIEKRQNYICQVLNREKKYDIVEFVQNTEELLALCDTYEDLKKAAVMEYDKPEESVLEDVDVMKLVLEITDSALTAIEHGCNMYVATLRMDEGEKRISLESEDDLFVFRLTDGEKLLAHGTCEPERVGEAVYYLVNIALFGPDALDANYWRRELVKRPRGYGGICC